MISCQEKFNGKTEESFKTSREKVEKELDKNEKTNLEKAMRVIAMEAMRLKWEESNKYDGKSFNKISLEMIDGLSYSAVVDLAEDILKSRNKKDIDNTNKEIDSLNQQKNERLTTQKKLNLFKINYLTLDKTDWFGEMVPELEIDYQYTGKEDLKGPKTIAINVYLKSTNKAIQLQTNTYGDNESILKPGESINEHIILSEAKEKNPKLWDAAKYPVEKPNLSDYDLELKVEVLSLFLNGKKIELPKTKIEDIESEIKTKKSALEELKTVKGTLDELELTDN